MTLPELYRPATVGNVKFGTNTDPLDSVCNWRDQGTRKASIVLPAASHSLTHFGVRPRPVQARAAFAG